MSNENLTTAPSSSDLILRLKALKPVRNETQLLRKAQHNYEAALANGVGSEQNPACSRCQRGAKIFDICSTPGDIFGGACASCHGHELDSACSFHESFPRISSEEAFSSASPSNRGPESLSDVQSTTASIRASSTPQSRSLSPAQRGSTPLLPSPTQIPTRAVPNRRTRRRYVRRVQQRGGFDFKNDIRKVHKSIYGSYQISRQLLQAVNDYMNDMFSLIAQEAATLAVMNKRKTIGKDDIKFAFRFVKGLNQKDKEDPIPRWLCIKDAKSSIN
ncbi:hypothetical protein N431DRAFT_477658 [Stipitochalara longipes BDJ]|nr:hypothetical protein N431DRAFT_477658 [Stipitochalara longipes BDJ]